MEVETGLGLGWTGHPLYDAGLAALVVFAGKNSPDDLTDADFENFAQYAEKAYFASDMVSSISVLFTLNNFMNPSYSLETKRQKTGEVLRSFANKAARDDLPMDVYTNQAAGEIAARDLIPMLTGRDTVNFSPYGHTGLPVSGHTLVILQALTLAALRSQGKILVIAADDPKLTLKIIRKWQPEIRRRVQLSEIKGEQIKSPQTRIIKVLVELENERRPDEEAELSSAITVYHLSNSGQGPSMTIYLLPATVTRFVQIAQIPRFKLAWQTISRRSWVRPKEKGSVPDINSEPDAESQRSLPNRFYDALFSLPQEATSFIRRFLKGSVKSVVKRGVNNSEAEREQAEQLLKSIWNLTELFLEEVLNMDKERIGAIRDLGDALAVEVAGENDRRLFDSLTRQVRTYGELRGQILKVNKRRLKNRQAPVLDFDGFLLIFEEGEELAKTDWRLAWDLVQMRFFDELYRRKWFDLHREALEESETEEEELALA